MSLPAEPSKPSDCPVNASDLDLIPECYHNLNKCLCFLCTCGSHVCPSQSKQLYNKSIFSSNYRRSYSRHSVSRAPKRTQSFYKPNSSKMDLITTYMKEFKPQPISNQKSERSTSPQPSFKFEGKSQYYRDFPNWGPTDYEHVKRPVNPIHETKIKFRGKSSYDANFKEFKIYSDLIKGHRDGEIKKGCFEAPLVSTNQREYKASSSDHFTKQEAKKIEEYVALFYNPNQFRTTSRLSYVQNEKALKDPNLIRREALLKRNK